LLELLALVGELRRVGVARWVVELVAVDCLTKSSSHGDVVCKVGSKSAVKVCIAGLKVCSETTVLHWQVVSFLLVHLFIDYILLRDSERTASTALVNLTSTSGALDTSFQTTVTTARGSDVSSEKELVLIRESNLEKDKPLLVLLMSTLSLERLRSGHSSDWRHFCVVCGVKERGVLVWLI